MRIEAVVINASPLITLFRSGQADILPRISSALWCRKRCGGKLCQMRGRTLLRANCASNRGRCLRMSIVHHGLRPGHWVLVKPPC